MAWADTQNGAANILIPGTAEDEGWEYVRHGTEVRKALINPAMLDIAFAGTPLGVTCSIGTLRHSSSGES